MLPTTSHYHQHALSVFCFVVKHSEKSWKRYFWHCFQMLQLFFMSSNTWRRIKNNYGTDTAYIMWPWIQWYHYVHWISWSAQYRLQFFLSNFIFLCLCFMWTRNSQLVIALSWWIFITVTKGNSRSMICKL